MRATRAYIAGFGTTAVLISSSFALLAVVTAIVAFNGWPDLGIDDRVESVVLDRDERFDVSGPARTAADAASGAAAVAASPVPAARAPDAPAPTGGPGPAPGAPRPDTDSPFAPAPGSAPPGPAQAPPSSAPPSPPGPGALPGIPGQLGQALGDTAEQFTGPQGLGGAVGNVSPALGETVTQAGQVVAGLLRDPRSGVPRADQDAGLVGTR